MEELRIQCPSCSIILDVRNSKNEAVKRIKCPNCKTVLDVRFHDENPSKQISATLHYGEAIYSLKEGLNVIGRKHPSSKSNIQIATGDPSLHLEHASVNMVCLTDGRSKCIVKTLGKKCLVIVDGLALTDGDEVVLGKGDEMQLGDTLLIYK